MSLKRRSFFYIFIFLTLGLMIRPAMAASSLSGRILLQVNKGGEAWYVDPVSNKRAFLGRPTDAFNVMRSFGLGVSNDNLRQIRQSTSRRQKLSGRILLQVEASGAAFYISPTDLTLNYLGRPSDAFALMRSLAVGISNSDIAKISVDPRYTDKVVVTPLPSTGTATSTATTTPVTVSNAKIIASNPCQSWTYSSWSACSVWGNQTRTIDQTAPDGCFMPYNPGSDYVLEQPCTIFSTSTASSTLPMPSDSNLSSDDRFLSAAFADNGKTFSNSDWTGECKAWVSRVASSTFGGNLPLNNNNYYTWNLDSCASGNFQVLYRSVAIEKADRGDIIQFHFHYGKTDCPHTAIIVTRTPTGMVWIHSNWVDKDYTVNHTVRVNFITYQYFQAIAGTQYSVYHIYPL